MGRTDKWSVKSLWSTVSPWDFNIVQVRPNPIGSFDNVARCNMSRRDAFVFQRIQIRGAVRYMRDAEVSISILFVARWALGAHELRCFGIQSSGHSITSLSRNWLENYITIGDVVSNWLLKAELTAWTGIPRLRNSRAAKVETAPPSECPVVTTWKVGFSLRASWTASTTLSRISWKASTYPLAPAQPVQYGIDICWPAEFELPIVFPTLSSVPWIETTMSWFSGSIATKPPVW
jgi:hypothetical protein